MNYNSKHTLIKKPQEGYNLVADQYAKYHGHLDSFEQGTLKRLLPRTLDNKDIIDLGAGDGRLLKYFKDIKFNSYTACDIAENLLKKHPGKLVHNFNPETIIARNDNDEAILKVICDLEKPLPFLDEVYDLALSFFVLEHIKDIDHLFGETYRILKTGGSRMIGHFLQRRAFSRKANQDKFKIQLFNHKLEELKKIAEYHFFEFKEYPIHEKGELLGWIIVCKKT